MDQVVAAARDGTPLVLQAGGSKHFIGGTRNGGSGKPTARSDAPETGALAVNGHCGIINYEPTELVVTVRAGTPLAELERTLHEAGQMLPFEPPRFPGATIGGTLACGLSGPRRPWAGAARDFVLGMRIINGLGQDLHFGGEVMKNVAGYDVSRLHVGAFGTLGVLLDMSMKVLPQPAEELTLVVENAEADDAASLIPASRQSYPLFGAAVIGSKRYLRFSGSDAALKAAVAHWRGEVVADTETPWDALRDMTHPFFTGDNGSGVAADGVRAGAGDERVLWRLSLPPAVPMADLKRSLEGDWLIDWGGALRWLKSDVPARTVFATAARFGGHAIRYSVGGEPGEIFQPLSGTMQRLQSRLRDSFDPQRLFNPGRFHPELDIEKTQA